jgi:hypothetical protein
MTSQQTYKYNHRLSKLLEEKASKVNVEDWYENELVKSNMEFINFLERI